MRTAMTFSISVIPTADVLYALASVPVTDHGDEAVAAVPTGQQAGIAVLLRGFRLRDAPAALTAPVPEAMWFFR